MFLLDGQAIPKELLAWSLMPSVHPPPPSPFAQTMLKQAQDDDDHSSGDFQNQSFDDPDDKDVIRALGMENVRRLASMTDGELADYEDSSSVDSQIAEDARSQSSSDLSSEDMPQVRFCTNCTSDMDPGQSVCAVRAPPPLPFQQAAGHICLAGINRYSKRYVGRVKCIVTISRRLCYSTESTKKRCGLLAIG